MEAYIRSTDENNEALYLVVGDDDSGTVHPILAEEVEAIRDACNEWLEEHGK